MPESQDDSLLIKTLGNSPQLRIIDFLMDNRLFDFSKKEIIKGARLSKTTFYKTWEHIERSGIVRISREFGKTQLYTLNLDDPTVKELTRLELLLIRRSAPEASKEIVTPPIQGRLQSKG